MGPKWVNLTEAKMCSKCFGLICQGMLPLFFMMVSVGLSCPVANLTNEFWAVRTWKLTSSQQSQRHNFFGCSNSPIHDSNRTVPLLCASGPLQPKLGLTTPIGNSLFTRNPNLEEKIAYQLGIVRTEYYGKSFEGRQCSKFLSCSAFLKEVVPSSDHPLVECLEALHRVVVGVFGQILVPEFENDTRKFEETLMGAMRTHNLRFTPKLHVLVHHVPEYVRRTGVARTFDVLATLMCPYRHRAKCKSNPWN